MIKRLIYKWLLKDLNCSYDAPDRNIIMFLHEMWSKDSVNFKKVLKIHKGNCIEKFAKTKDDAELIREVIEGLESFILLYYDTVEHNKK